MVYTFEETSGVCRTSFTSSPKAFYDGSVIHYDFSDFEKLSDRSEPHDMESKFELQKQAATTSITKTRSLDARQGSSDRLVDTSSTCPSRNGVAQIDDAQLPSKILPPWTLSLVASLQSAATSRCTKAFPRERALSFEKQFGWDILLCTRLGSAWQVTGQNRRVSHSVDVPRPQGEVVKVWSGRQRKLLKRLKVGETSTSALHEESQNGLACVGTQNGEISLWDAEKGTCVSSVCCVNKAVCALCMDSTKGMTFGGMGCNLSDGGCAWDHRSFNEPILNWAKVTTGEDPIAGLKCRGHELCIAGGGEMWVLDLRRLNGGNATMTFSADEVKKSKAGILGGAMTEEDEEERNACWVATDGEEEEEDLGDECGAMIEQDASISKLSRGASFMSRCKFLIRSMSLAPSPSAPVPIGTSHQQALCESIA